MYFGGLPSLLSYVWWRHTQRCHSIPSLEDPLDIVLGEFVAYFIRGLCGFSPAVKWLEGALAVNRNALAAWAVSVAFDLSAATAQA